MHKDFSDMKLMWMHEGLPDNGIQLGRINCRLYKQRICDRLVRHRKFPMFMVLVGDKAYDFYKGNLTYSYVEQHIQSQNYLQHAVDKDKQMEQEGITWSNYNRYSVYNIKRLVKTNYGSRFDLLKESVTDHSYRLKQGVVLIAKAAGVKKYFEDDDTIFNLVVGACASFFVLLLAVMIYESR